MKWLHADALEATGKDDFLGADLMIPLLVMCLIHAKIPSIHLIMQFIRNYGQIDPCGESAYIMTCVEAAVAFIDRLEVPQEVELEAAAAYAEHENKLKGAGLIRNSSKTRLDDPSSPEFKMSPRPSSSNFPNIHSSGNLAGMDDDAATRISGGNAQEVTIPGFHFEFSLIDTLNYYFWNLFSLIRTIWKLLLWRIWRWRN